MECTAILTVLTTLTITIPSIAIMDFMAGTHIIAGTMVAFMEATSALIRSTIIHTITITIIPTVMMTEIMFSMEEENGRAITLQDGTTGCLSVLQEGETVMFPKEHLQT